MFVPYSLFSFTAGGYEYPEFLNIMNLQDSQNGKRSFRKIQDVFSGKPVWKEISKDTFYLFNIPVGLASTTNEICQYKEPPPVINNCRKYIIESFTPQKIVNPALRGGKDLKDII